MRDTQPKVRAGSPGEGGGVGSPGEGGGVGSLGEGGGEDSRGEGERTAQRRKSGKGGEGSLRK